MTRKLIKDIIEIPEEIIFEIEGRHITMSKGDAKISKRIEYDAKKDGNKIIIECEKPTKRIKKLIKSSSAHIRNAINGLDKKYVYKLQICAVHFPMNIAIKGQELIIKNFLGEVKERKAVILPDVSVKIDKEIITVEGHDKEKVGQTAANMEQATRITNRDRRIFQDGIYIIEKCKGAKR